MHRLLLIVLLGVLIWPAGAAQAQTTAPRFESAACMFPNASRLSGLACGYLTVPARHANPAGPTIRLAVVIARSTGASPAADPLVLAQGGPGGSTIDLFGQQLLLTGLESIRSERDIVLFDQRGTYYSQPNLLCPETIDLTIRTIEQRLTRAEAAQQYQEALLACRTRLVAEGVDLAAYNTVENAADIAMLSQELGYQQINLYGVSYGTLLALETMRNHPDVLRSVIIDSVVPPQTNANSEVPRSMDRAFGELFRACAAEQSCNRAYPNLESNYFALLDQLDANPARVAVTDPDTKKTYNAVIDGDGLFAITFQLLYSSAVIPLLPMAIDDARRGDLTLFGRFLPQLFFQREFANGMYYSVECAEDADFTPADVDLASIRPEIAKRQQRDAADFIALCQRWSVPDLGPAVDAPVISTIPTLVLSGQFDPITPPAFAATAAETLSQSYSFVLPDQAHGVMTDNACAQGIARAFLNDPQVAPASGCIASQPPLRFITPENTIPVAGLGDILAALSAEDYTRLWLIIALVAFLLTVLLIWPVTWLIRRIRGRPAEPDLAARLAPWLAALAALVALGIVIALLVVVVAVATNYSEVLLFVGAPREYAIVFLLPIGLGLLALGLLVCAVLAWRRGSWGIFRRVYFSLLTLAALGLAGLLANFVAV